MKHLSLLLPVIFFCLAIPGCAPEEKPGTAQTTFNRPPLALNPYAELPLGAVRPEGWLREMLQRQADGLTGHLDEYYPLVMGPDNGWLGGDGDQWERGPYWIHGLITLAYSLDDRELIDKTTPWIEWILKSQKENGYFGPDTDYENLPGVQRENSADWWPRMVVLKVLKQYYSATKDERVIQLMSDYFRYQLEMLPSTPLDHWTFWARYRGGDNMMMVYWLYNITGASFLLELADLLHEQTFDYTGAFLQGDLISQQENIHCVNLAQGIKQPVVRYQQEKEKYYLESVKKALNDLRKYSGQPQGMFGGDEALRNNNPLNGVEFCSVVELMFSLETILPVTGDPDYADHLERIAFNALPAQATDDFMARQYFQQANQVMVTRHHRGFSLNHQGTDVCFGLLTGYPCCTSNMHQGWPLFTQNLWYATPEGGLAALVYAPCNVTAKVGTGQEVTIREETGYPFEDRIRLVFTTNGEEVRFPLDLRVPGWCREAVITVNDQPVRTEKGGRIVRIERTWSDADVLELHLPADIRFERWYENSVSVERGPLVFALEIGEDWRLVKNQEDPERYGDHYFEVLPDTPWNYGLVNPQGEMDRTFQVDGSAQLAAYPWNQDNAPITIRAIARQIPSWKLYNHEAGPLPYSIQYNPETGPEEEVRLIPYGCTALRISEFPLLGNYSVME